MKKFTLFVCLATIGLQYLSSMETKSLNLGAKVGEVIGNPVPGQVFHLVQDGDPGNVFYELKYAKRYPINPEIKLYTLENIYCLNAGVEVINAYTLDDKGDETHYEIYVNIAGNKTSVGWHGRQEPNPEAAQSVFNLRPQKRANPLPAFFVCTGAEMVNNEMVCSWEEIPMEDYNYESANSNLAFVSSYHYNGDSLVVNGTGETIVTMSVDGTENSTLNGKQVSYGKLEHSFIVKSKLNMEINLSSHPGKEKTLLINDGNEITSYYGFCEDISVKPEGAAGSMAPSNYGKTLTVRLTDDSEKDVIELSQDANDYYCFQARDYGTVKVEIIMPETDEYMEGRDTLTIHVEPDGYDLTYDPKPLGYEDDPNEDFITELNLREGDTIALPHLMDAGPGIWERFHPHYLVVKMNGLVGMPMDGARVMDSLHAVAAGEDEVVYTYYRSPKCTPTVVKLPVHISTLLEPQTTINLTANPGEDGNIILNAYYNETEQAVEIDDALTDAAVEEAMKKNACGTDEWKKALPNSMSFNLPAGKVTISILCRTQTGYELRAKVRGQEVTVIPSQTGEAQTHTFTYELDAPAAVVFYMVKVPGTPLNPAPRRMKKAGIEEAVSVIKSINIDRQDIVTTIGNVQSEPSGRYNCTKVIENGVLYLMYNGTKYNVQGMVVK